MSGDNQGDDQGDDHERAKGEAVADNVGGHVRAKDTPPEEFANAVANLIYNAVPWGKAARNKYLLAVKLGALGVKSLTPEYQAFETQDERLRDVAATLNELGVIIQGVDAEDLIRAVGVRGTIRGIKRYLSGGADGGIMMTTTFFPDP